MAHFNIRAVAAAAVVVLLLTAPYAANAITCGDVASAVSPCLTYARGTGGTPPATCCAGVKNLNSKAASSADRKMACTCLKNLAKSVKFNTGTVAALPGKCGVNVGFPISTSTDCSKVN